MADQQPSQAPQPAPSDQHTGAPAAPSGQPTTAAATSDTSPAGELGDLRAGEFEIGDTVIAKIAHMACREVDGVHALGGATSRALSSLRVADSRTQGVAVDVRGDGVDVDITLVVTYGRSIPEVAQACRERVRDSIEATTGLTVKTVNVVVGDIHFPGDPPAGESGQA
jgi:uncharacterized alkaline shock family protein YloU